ncbi:MAG: hypothetical protein WAW61_06710 [Methylococcaceae bacterium]
MINQSSQNGTQSARDYQYRNKKPSPGKFRARVGLVGADDGGLPSGESVLQL